MPSRPWSPDQILQRSPAPDGIFDQDSVNLAASGRRRWLNVRTCWFECLIAFDIINGAWRITRTVKMASENSPLLDYAPNQWIPFVPNGFSLLHK